MLGDDERLKAEIEFATQATYDKFAWKWAPYIDKVHWLRIWPKCLAEFTVQEINTIADYCIKGFSRPPRPAEFGELVRRQRAGRSLSEPIVSRIERMAYLILSSDEFSRADISFSQVSDACLIAAALAYLKENLEVLPEILEHEGFLPFFGDRAQMFCREALIWKKDAEQGKGYWHDMGIFKPRRSKV